MMTHARTQSSSPFEVFWIFLKLGLTSFGGPVAHIGYFHAEFVSRRKWLDDESFTELVALCQFLPGPASSQLGIAIGWQRAKALGSIAAWLGFTLPSALILIALAYGFSIFDLGADNAWLHGLKLAAVAFVAQALWSMGKPLRSERIALVIALASAALVSLAPGTASQILAIGLGAVAGSLFIKPKLSPSAPDGTRSPNRAGLIPLILFFGLLTSLPLLAQSFPHPLLKLTEAMYRAGSLVFGGGHVVLPLLQSSTVETGLVSQSHFIAGYSFAQGVPGPLFSIAAYLGTVSGEGSSAWAGGVMALLAIFLPGYLLIIGVLPHWDAIRRRPKARTVLAGINAAALGLLLAAFYNPIWSEAIQTPLDFVIAALCFVALVVFKISPLLTLVIAALTGLLRI